MGKRKERRLAAMSAAGRRVKLDLFAEPSGDFGESSTKEEVGGDGNSKIVAGSPNSPSSSGERPENPLLLLGQYSDEELEEELGKGENDSGESSPAEPDAQVKVAGGEGTAADKDGDLAAQQVEQEKMEHSPSLNCQHKMEKKDVRDDNEVDYSDLHTEKIDTVEQMSVPGISDLQTTGDVNSGWKMVLHEESNSYYYWNTVTGETSWEVPSGLGQQTETSDPKSSAEMEVDDALVDTRMSNAMLDVERDASLAAQPNNGNINALISEARSDSGIELDLQNEQYTDHLAHIKDNGNYLNVGDVRMVSGANYGVTISKEFASLRHSNDASLSNRATHYTDFGVWAHENQETVGDPFSDSSRLLQLAEYLLGRLQLLKGSGEYSDQISKFVLELDIRLKDMKSLVPYGSSLLPFWLHSENQLKQMEGAINRIVLKCSESAKTGETEDVKNLRASTCEASIDEKHATSSTSFDSHSSDNSNIKGVDKDSSNSPAVQPDNVASVRYPSSYDDSAAGGGTVKAHENTAAAVTRKCEFPSEEDVDMDVEMEVEEAVPVSSKPFGDVSVVQHGSQPDHSAPPNLQSQNESIELEEGEVAPPPDEEWIPPPPPDDEPIPPPPPDDPPEDSFPQPQLEIQTVQPYSYAEQYGLTYPGSNFEYYGGQTNTEVPSNGYYVDANGCQVAAPVPTLYYATVTNPYPDATSVVNSVEPVSYYALQGGSVPVASAVGSVETSGSHSLSTGGSIASFQTGLAEAQNEVGFTSVSSSLVNVSAIDREMKNAPLEVPSVPVCAHAPTTTSSTTATATQGVSVVSAPAVAAKAAMTESVSAVQPKVSRGKKRTVTAVSTLRSNKKVSGLVDKWKAVKEELHEDEEDEPESAYEILEKKRLREIEQWHAQQIASGEAKDNANFQPLGGDWRERVKRKRAKRMSGGEENLHEGHNEGNQQPDLDELSKQLPSGWQAYWDESSKQVYYGNLATAETTWIKPTS